MGILKKITSLFTPGGDAHAYRVKVRCNRCGEILVTRVDLRNDLSIEYGNGERYFCRKVLIGDQRCFEKVEVQLEFNANRKLIDRQISGGEFVDD
jgi:hypothetical protein